MLMIMRCQFTKIGDIAYISHLDILNVLHRGINRSKIKIKYSEGFNPHPKLAFSPALSLGVNSIAEYVDIELEEQISPKELIKRLNLALPEGIEIAKAKLCEDKKSLSAKITHNIYKIAFSNKENDTQLLEQVIKAINQEDEIIVEKTNKKGQTKTYNQKEKIYELNCNQGKDTHIVIAVLQNSPQGALKVSEFIEILNKQKQNLNPSPTNDEFVTSEIIKMSSISIEDGEIFEVM